MPLLPGRARDRGALLSADAAPRVRVGRHRLPPLRPAVALDRRLARGRRVGLGPLLRADRHLGRAAPGRAPPVPRPRRDGGDGARGGGRRLPRRAGHDHAGLDARQAADRRARGASATASTWTTTSARSPSASPPRARSSSPSPRRTCARASTRRSGATAEAKLPPSRRRPRPRGRDVRAARRRADAAGERREQGRRPVGAGLPAAGMTDVPVLYIGGWGRSGSTLLAHVLAEVPGSSRSASCATCGRPGPAGNELCGCGLAFAECPFWTAVGAGGLRRLGQGRRGRGARARGGRPAPPQDPAARAGPARARARPPGAPLRRADRATSTAAILTVSGAQVVVDSTKNPPYAYFLRAARASGVRLRVLHLVRDSRGVVHSWMKRVARPEVTTGDGAYFQEFSPVSRRACAGWSATWRSSSCGGWARRPCGCATSRSRPIRAASSSACSRRWASPASTTCPRSGDSVQVAGQHSVRGNPMRFAHGRQQVRADEAWRTGMARQDSLAGGAGDLAAAASLRLSPPGIPVGDR